MWVAIAGFRSGGYRPWPQLRSPLREVDLERVRQRQAELTTVSGQSDEMRLRLAELQASEFVQEPVPVSPRPVIGPIMVWGRKAFFHLFMKWYARPTLMQVNQFHGSVGAVVRDMVEANRLLGDENRKLQARVQALEALVTPPDA